jgi:hypothetical protein
VLGTISFVTDNVVAEIWLAVNLWAAFLHYAYDGMIWKLRDAGTSKTLGVQIPSNAYRAAP